MSAYREAIRAAERRDPFTKASVTRTVIDSGRALAGRLRTREEGVEDLAESLEKYSAALRPEDWVEKVGPVKKIVMTAAALIGITAGVMAGFAVNLIVAVVDAGFVVGSNIARIIITPGVLFVGLRILQGLYLEYQTGSSGPSTSSAAQTILERTVDPAEGAMYSLLGGSRPARTVERVSQVAAVVVGAALFILAAAFTWGVTQSLMPQANSNKNEAPWLKQSR
jgi:hypothetical protein